MNPDSILHGELGLIGLFDLGQLLMLNRATGCLTVQRDDRRAFLYFIEGRLVNALDENLVEGERAAYRVFTWRTGAFEFRAEPATASVTIQVSTDSVMLEAARRMDEAALAAGAPAPPGIMGTFLGEEAEPSEAERLMTRQAALEELRDVFQRVVASAPARYGPGAGPMGCLHSLVEAEDRLIFQAGQRPALRHRGAWCDAHPDALGPAAYQELRKRIMQRLQAPGPLALPGPRRLRLDGGNTLALEVVGSAIQEALWLRSIELLPPTTASMNGDHEALADVLALHPAIVLVGGPDLASARALLHAMLADLVENQQTTLLVVTSDPTYRLPGAAGVALRVPPAELRPALRAVEPGVVVLDPGMAGGDVTLEELTLVPRVLAGVVAAEAGSLLPRWLARLDGRGPLAAAGNLAATTITVALAASDEQEPGFSVYRYSDEEREMALRGEPVTPSVVVGRPAARLGATG